ncbi:calcium-binding protein [Gloeocapsa sp. BRSZ]
MALIIGTAGNENSFEGGTSLLGTSENDDIFGLDGNDHIVGFAGNDLIDGGAGDDFLFGDVGDNLLFGGAGNDFLSAGGKNVLDGGAGNDRYQFDGDDTIIEAANGGLDQVSALTNFTLPANVENLDLIQGTNGTGNNLSNQIIGNSASNTLDGNAGNDTLDGGGGNDRLLGRVGNDTLTGGDGSDALIGGDGNDLLVGGLGTDVLNGGAGADHFRFNAPNEGSDFIIDFVAVNDSIQVSATGFGSGLTAGSAISADQFRIGTAAGDATDRFIYNNTNGAVFFDADGTGSASQVQLATLTGAPTISNLDIVVI